MPADPLEFRVLQNLQAALQAISVAGGYHYTVGAVAVKLDPNQDVEALLGEDGLRPFMVVEVNPDAFTYKPSRRVTVVMPIAIHVVHDSDPSVDESYLRTFLRLCADVEQAIGVDIHRGGPATDTIVTSREYRAFGGREVWATVKTQIRVDRVYGSPNG